MGLFGFEGRGEGTENEDGAWEGRGKGLDEGGLD